jgi:ligand-binding sensor domain-containing protein
MRRTDPIKAAGFGLALAAFVLGLITVARGEQLPIRHYGVPDGLPHSSVNCVFQDSKGYLWIGTADGLARFDGYRFTTYDASDGLGNSFINSIIEDRQGKIWIATNGGGVSCFVDWAPPSRSSTTQKEKASGPRFVTFEVSPRLETNRVNGLVFDANDRLWCATDGGLYRAAISAGKVDNVRFEAVVDHGSVALTMGAFADSRGRLWFGIADTIVEAISDRIITYKPGALSGLEIGSFAEDRSGQVLAASTNGLLEFVEPPYPERPGSWKASPLQLPNCRPLHCVIKDHEGALWIGAEHGLIKRQNDKTSVYSTSNGLSDNCVRCLFQDRDRNVWIGTLSGGLCMLSGEPAVALASSDGLPDATISKLFQDHAGHVYVSAKGSGLFEISAGKVLPVKWSQTPLFKDIGLRITQDSRGDWWIGTDRGIFRFRGPDLHRARGRLITAVAGGPETRMAGQGDIIEGPEGKLWFGSSDNLFCIDRSINGNPEIHLVPVKYQGPYRRLISDGKGGIWIGSQSFLARLINGELQKPMPAAGLPETSARAFYLDSRGWLWVGLRTGGVSVTKDPSADSVEFTNYSTADGLASNTVWSISEDDSGRIYLGTGRGVARLDPITGRIRHITAGDKLAGDAIGQCMKDKAGNMWIATNSTVIMLGPKGESVENRPPPIYLTRLQVAGAELALPDGGAISVPPVTLGPSGNNLLIEYVGLDFRSDHELKYQYRLEGVDAQWSALTDQRSVNYAGLGPGSYKFLVRAVNQDGAASPEPATVEVRILPPVWRRWWFLLAAGAMIALGAYAAHRYRVARLMELLTVRTRIASDLHDDIGSNLTKIAILSEVAHQQLGNGSSVTESPLPAIGRISRESVASMSDIVWAIDPRRDTHQDLVRRMRQFALDMLGGAGIEVRIVMPGDDQPRRVGPDYRRQVFLIFKEAVHNAARHSGCSKVEIAVAVERGGLTLRVRDNGAGFDTGREGDGQGLASMRKRAMSLGGSLQVVSGKEGTTVTLDAPWARPKGPTYLRR